MMGVCCLPGGAGEVDNETSETNEIEEEGVA